MASTLVFPCPQCNKRLKGPADLEGKKIRCKACSHVFVARSAAPPQEAVASSSPTQKLSQPTTGKPPADDDMTPYGVTTEKFTARCPHCAAELESEDAIICLECGYNNVTRQLMGTKKVVAPSASDVTAWLMPGFICVGVIVVCLGFVVFLIIWRMGFPADEVGVWQNLKNAGFVWGLVVSAVIIFLAGRFAINRLILNPRPPEEELK